MLYGLKKPLKDMATAKQVLNVIDRSKLLSTYVQATIDKHHVIRLSYRELYEAKRAKQLLDTY